MAVILVEGFEHDHDDATGLPPDPSGGNVTVVWAATEACI